MFYIEETRVFSAIDEFGVTVTIKAATADFEEANVVVKDNKGNVVETEATLVAEGDTEVEFSFVKTYTGDFEGVWTVDSVEYDFEVLNQFNAIVEAAEAGNEIKFQDALDAAGITYADETKMADYMGAIKDQDGLDLGDDFELATLADVQKVINAVDKSDADADAAKVKTVADAKTQKQLLVALQANFEAVNADWILEYEEAIGELDFEDEDNPVTVDNIQDEIYDANEEAIEEVEIESAADVAKVRALVVKWIKPDAEEETDKAGTIQELNVLEATYKIVEAKTANTVYTVLVNYDNVIADEEDDDQLKVSDLNANLKQFYYEIVKDTENDGATPFEPDNDTPADIKEDIVDEANEVALKAAMVEIKTAYEAINTAEGEEEGSTTAKQKSALKAALQKLADYTSHEREDEDKFDMSIVVDDNLVAYLAQFAEATAIDETSDVTAVVEDVNTVNEGVGEAALYKALNDAKTAQEVHAALLGLELEDYINVPSADRLFVAEALLNREDPDEIDADGIVALLTAAINVRDDALEGINELSAESTITEVVEALEAIDSAYAAKGTVAKADIAEAFFDGLVFGDDDALKTPFKTIAAVKAAANL